MARLKNLGRIFLLPLILMQLLMAAPAQAQVNGQDIFATLFGAVTGGIVGNRLSPNGNRAGGTAVGAAVGGVLGLMASKIFSPRQDDLQPYAWREGRYHGTTYITEPSYAYRNSPGVECRRYRTVIVDTYTGRRKTFRSVRCHRDDTWGEPQLDLEGGEEMYDQQVIPQQSMEIVFLPNSVVDDYVTATFSDEAHRGNIYKLVAFLNDKGVSITQDQFHRLVGRFKHPGYRREAAEMLKGYLVR